MRDLTFATWMLMTATFCMTAVAKGRRWLRQSTIRLVLMLAAAVLLVIALGT